MNTIGTYDAVVIGGSSGSMEVIKQIIFSLQKGILSAVIVVYHIHADSGDFMVQYMNERSSVFVKQPVDKETIESGTVYVAPPNYHLLVEWDHSFALSVDEPVNYSRPSIDVLFESAADVYASRLIGVILSGANSDGSMGLKCIKDQGGTTVVQHPESAEMDTMPRSALSATTVDFTMQPEKIGKLITRMVR